MLLRLFESGAAVKEGTIPIRLHSSIPALLSLLLLQLPLGSTVLVCRSHMERQSAGGVESMSHAKLTNSGSELSDMGLPDTEEGCDAAGGGDTMGAMSCSILFCPLSSREYAAATARRSAIDEHRNTLPAPVDTSPDFPPPRSALL